MFNQMYLKCMRLSPNELLCQISISSSPPVVRLQAITAILSPTHCNLQFVVQLTVL